MIHMKMTSKFILGFLVLILYISCGSKHTRLVKTIESNKFIKTQVSNQKPISPILVGTNVWFNELSRQVWDLTAQSGVKSIRIGGHAYDKAMPSKEQLLDWVKKIQAMGAEPIIQVSQYDSPEAAAEIVKFFNVDLASGKAVKYWNIGNEPWLQNNKPELSTVGSMVENYFKPRSVAMKNTDPTIKIYGPDFCYYIEKAVNDLFGGKNDISGKIPGQNYYYCDGISWHRYPQDTSINLAYEGIDDFKKSIVKCKTTVDRVNRLHSRNGNDALGWGIGEFNAKGGPQVHTWENGQMFGGVLDLCMKYEATYATTWSMFEHGGDRQGTDFSFIDGSHMIPRPSYRHLQMIADNFSGFYLEGESSLKDIITFGSIDGNKISVMIMNRSKSPVNYNLNLNYTNIVSGGGAIALNINADSDLSYDGSIEALATDTYIFENNKITRIAYTNDDFISEKAPVKTVL